MQITQSAEGGVAIYRLEGNLDSTTSPKLQSALTAASETSRIAIDLTRVAFVSSAGLRVILSAAKQAQAAGGAVALFGLNNPVSEAFEIAGFGRLMTIAATETEALATLRR